MEFSFYNNIKKTWLWKKFKSQFKKGQYCMNFQIVKTKSKQPRGFVSVLIHFKS